MINTTNLHYELFFGKELPVIAVVVGRTLNSREHLELPENENIKVILYNSKKKIKGKVYSVLLCHAHCLMIKK